MYSLSVENGRPSGASHFYSISLRYPFIALIIILFFVLYPASPSSAQSPVSDFNPASLTESPNGIFFNGKTFWADNSLPLRAIFFDKWGGPFRPDNINRSDNYWKTEAALINKGWRIAGFYRGELFMETNKDTIEILRMVNLKEGLPTGRVFDIDMKARGFSATGVEISNGMNLDSVSEGLMAGFTARYLRGEKIQEGKIEGKVTATGPMSYDFNLLLDYIYDENLIYNRRNTISGTGDGYSFDIGLKYIFKDNLNAEVLFRDIGGRIYWRDAPYTTANATSDIKSYDEHGYQVYSPTIQGYESYKDFTQKIPLKTDVVFSYKREVFTLTPTVNLIGGRPLYWIEIGYQKSSDSSIMAGYNINYHAFSIGYTYKKVSFDIYLSDIDLSRANAVGLELSLWH